MCLRNCSDGMMFYSLCKIWQVLIGCCILPRIQYQPGKLKIPFSKDFWYICAITTTSANKMYSFFPSPNCTVKAEHKSRRWHIDGISAWPRYSPKTNTFLHSYILIPPCQEVICMLLSGFKLNSVSLQRGLIRFSAVLALSKGERFQGAQLNSGFV